MYVEKGSFQRTVLQIQGSQKWKEKRDKLAFMKSQLEVTEVTTENHTLLGDPGPGTINDQRITSPTSPSDKNKISTNHMKHKNRSRKTEVKEISEIHFDKCKIHHSQITISGMANQHEQRWDNRFNTGTIVYLTDVWLINTGLETEGVEKIAIKNSRIETNLAHKIFINEKKEEDDGKMQMDGQLSRSVEGNMVERGETEMYGRDTMREKDEEQGAQRMKVRDTESIRRASVMQRRNTEVERRLEEDEARRISTGKSRQIIGRGTKVKLINNVIINVDLDVRAAMVLSVTHCKLISTHLRIEGLSIVPKDDQITQVKIRNSELEDKATDATKTSKVCISSKSGFITFNQVKLKVIKSRFTMKCIAEDGFIEWDQIGKRKDHNALVTDHSQLRVIQSRSEAPEIRSTVPLIIVPYSLDNLQLRNVTFVCRFTLGSDTLDIRSILQCRSYCEMGQYRRNNNETDHQHAVIVAEKQRHSKIHFNGESPACPLCPMGATCGKNDILPLPDYWGYRNRIGEVTMMRCPKDYCCTGSDTCKSIDSCRFGRTGTLCGRCEGNTTESLFSPNCVSTNNCQKILVTVAYIATATVYAIFLMFFNDIKNLLLKKIKAIPKYLKCKKSLEKNGSSKSLDSCLKGETKKFLEERSQLVDSLLLASYTLASSSAGLVHDVPKLTKGTSSAPCPGNESKTKKNKTSIHVIADGKDEAKVTKKKDKDSDSGTKYLQILFYYVQDASLFKVYLPVIGTPPESWLVHFLQFSPEMLLIYTDITEMCFKANTTAAMKVFLKSLFGPCVMLIQLLIYLSQWFTSTVVLKDPSRFSAL